MNIIYFFCKYMREKHYYENQNIQQTTMNFAQEIFFSTWALHNSLNWYPYQYWQHSTCMRLNSNYIIWLYLNLMAKFYLSWYTLKAIYIEVRYIENSINLNFWNKHFNIYLAIFVLLAESTRVWIMLLFIFRMNFVCVCVILWIKKRQVVCKQ